MSSPSKIPYTKPPKTFSDQVKQLISRGLVVVDIEHAEYYLSQINYYRFAAYCLPFEENHQSHKFKKDTCFDDVLNLYIFDRELRLLVLDAIERFEVSFRTQMAYHLSHNHNTAHPHLKPDIFFNPVTYGISVSKLSNDVRSSKEDFIKHLTRKYEEILPPIWAVVELMTMGQLSKWFTNIKERQDRQSIAAIYKVDEKILGSFCKHVTTIRNHCAHHARVWNRDYTVTMMLPKRGADSLVSGINQLPDHARMRRKIYNSLVMLAYLMEVICEDSHWTQRLKLLLKEHQIDATKMGFPSDWQARIIWQDNE